jgi:hypothetical protein
MKQLDSVSVQLNQTVPITYTSLLILLKEFEMICRLLILGLCLYILTGWNPNTVAEALMDSPKLKVALL